MKKFILLIFAISFIVGCRYKDGPAISFRSVEKRLEGTWQVIGYTSNGVDSLQNYNDSCGCSMQISFPQDWYYINISFFTAGNSIYSPWNLGQFYFSNNDKIMNLNLNGTSYKSLGPIGCGGESEWEILKLTMTDLKISTNLHNCNYLISFKKE